MRLVFLFLFLQLIPIVSQGQNNYFATDSSISTGGKLIDDGERINAKFCQIQKGKRIIKYTPYEINEYGFEDGRVYFARDIQIGGSSQRVFLEQLVSGNTSLYYYEEEGLRTFFLEIDSTEFFELPKQDFDNEENNYTSILLDLTSDCPNFEETTRNVGYWKIPLTKYIESYNEGEAKFFPRFKYGLTIGYGLSRLTPSPDIQISYLKHLDFEVDEGFSIGFFMDSPILSSNISLHSELNFSRNGFSDYIHLDESDIDAIANISTITWPVLLRYTYPAFKVRPFINVGSYFSYNFVNEGYIYNATKEDHIISINMVENISFISDKQIGAVAGGGLEYQLNSDYILSFEFRYNLVFGSSDLESQGFSGLNFITGISF